MKTKTIYYKQNGEIDHFTTWINEHPLFVLIVIAIVGSINF